MPLDKWLIHGFLPFVLATLTGCVALPTDRGIPEVQALISARNGHELVAHDQPATVFVAELLRQPLTAESAVRVALINAPQIRLEYARLGLSSADVYDAGRLSNPRFFAATMNSNVAGAAKQTTFGLVQSFTDLLLLRARHKVAAAEFERSKQQAGHAILSLAAEVEIAYFMLAGAQKVLELRRKIAGAALVSADLAQRLFDAGNISARELAQEKDAATSLQLIASQAMGETIAKRATLNELLGLSADTPAWSSANALPMPVNKEDELDDLLRLATRSRLDLAAQRLAVTLLTQNKTTVRRYRYVGALEVGVETERGTDRSRITGPTLSLELPLFNHGAGKVARAEALQAQAEHTLHALEIGITQRVTAGVARVRIARGQVELVSSRLIPQREEIVSRLRQEVNFMLESPFALLLAKQQEYDAYQSYLEALRDYWVARAELSRDVGTSLPSTTQIRGAPDNPTLPLTPPPSSNGRDREDGIMGHDLSTPDAAHAQDTPHASSPPNSPHTPKHQHGGTP